MEIYNFPYVYTLLVLFIAHGLSTPLECKLQEGRELRLFTSLGSVPRTVPGSNRGSVNNW